MVAVGGLRGVPMSRRREKTRRVRLGANGVKFVWKKHISRRGNVYWRRTKYFFLDRHKYVRRTS